MKTLHLSILILLITVLAGSLSQVNAASSDVHFHGAVQPDKSQVHKGDVINFNGWSNAYQDWKAGYTELPNVTFDIEIADQFNQNVFKKTMTSDEKGNINFSMPVSSDFQFGKYTIKVSISKEGFPTYNDEQSSFYVVRTAQDIVQA